MKQQAHKQAATQTKIVDLLLLDDIVESLKKDLPYLTKRDL